MEINNGLFEFIKSSPTAFHAVDSIKEILIQNGYEQLNEEDAWCVKAGGKYYVIRNDSSIIALNVGNSISKSDAANPYGFNITASHSDSPTFKLKENTEHSTKDHYVRLNVEGYGGMICSSWFDRPLSIAGRVVVKDGNSFRTQLVKIDRDLVLIPNLPIHMNREANDGFKYNKQIDLQPIFTSNTINSEGINAFIPDECGLDEDNIYGSELYLYNRQEPTTWGKNNEFISAPRLDDLECAYTSLIAFVESANENNINVYACFDNEEVGSLTKQGADSTFLEDVLCRINASLGKNEQDYMQAIANGMMLSCDNAHALHPAHPEKYDSQNDVYMNEGIVIKSHAAQKYTSDALSTALFKEICDRAYVDVQYFSNRSDMAGGSTLGNISMAHVSINCVDIGLAQLSMHSAYETAGSEDPGFMVDAIKEFYNTHFCKQNGSIVL